MATIEEIQTALDILTGARLKFAPPAHELKNTARAWFALLRDIPGALLTQAAQDIAISADDFPTIRAVRAAAWQVKAHNGTSAAPDRFKKDTAGRPDGWVNGQPVDITNTHTPIMVVGRAGWREWKPGSAAVFEHTPEAQAEINAMIKRIGSRAMTPEEHDYIDSILQRSATAQAV